MPTCENCQKICILHDNNFCEACCKIIDKQMIPRSTSEWAKNQTSKPPICCYRVMSETYINIIYEVAYFQKENNMKDIFVCECPAWHYCWYNKNQQANQRTCKHIIAIRGLKTEQERIVSNSGKWLYKPSKI